MLSYALLHTTTLYYSQLLSYQSNLALFDDSRCYLPNIANIMLLWLHHYWGKKFDEITSLNFQFCDLDIDCGMSEVKMISLFEVRSN